MFSISKGSSEAFQELSEPIGPCSHKMKGFSKNWRRMFTPNFAQNLGTTFLAPSQSALQTPATDFAQPRLSRVKARSSPARDDRALTLLKRGCPNSGRGGLERADLAPEKLFPRHLGAGAEQI